MYRTVVRTRLRLVVRFAVAALALSAAAAQGSQVTKQAQKDLADGADVVLDDFAADLKERRTQFSTGLAAVDQKFADGTATLATLEDVFAALDSLQIGVRADIRSAENAWATTKLELVSQLFQAGVFSSDGLPKGFRAGEAGTSERVFTSVRKVLDKHMTAVEKRLRKTTKRFTDEFDAMVTFRLRAPDEFHEWGAGGAISPRPLSIDIVLAASQLGVANDGVVYLGGCGVASDGACDLGVSKNGVVSSSFTTITAGSFDRWQFVDANESEGDHQYTLRFDDKLGAMARIVVTVP